MEENLESIPVRMGERRPEIPGSARMLCRIFRGGPRIQRGKTMNDKTLKAILLLLAFVLLFRGSAFPAAAEAKVPSPEEFFGFRVGADFHLIDYGQALLYWRELEKSSKRIKLFDYGKSSLGKTMVFAAVSSEENIAGLENIKEITRRLSLVRGLSEEEALKLAAEGKAIVWIDGGLHATEVAPAQHIIQLTHDLLSEETPKFKKIRDEVIAMLALPNPDGMDMVAGWYKKNLGTPYETSPLPWLYQRYIGHDNNRDSFMLSVPETRNLNQVLHHEWRPHIFYNQHQESPFPTLIFVPPDCEPTNPNLHPLLLRWQNFIGSAMAMDFEAEGKQGVISRFLFDTWYPGYVTQVCDFHNIISTFSETFLFNYATPQFYQARDFPEEYKDFTSSMFFTNPWRGGWWHLRDAVEYCLTASKSVLDLAAKHREELLYAKYAMGKETMERYSKEPPFGWIIPREQRDSGVAAELIDNLIALDIEVYKSLAAFRADGIDYPEGTYILPTSQPFGRFLKTLFEVQAYPDLRVYPSLWQSIVEPIKLKIPPLQTYDVLGWTLPLQMGIKTTALNAPAEVKTERIRAAGWPEKKIRGQGSYAFAVPSGSNDCLRAANRLLKSGKEVHWARSRFQSGGTAFQPGTLIVPFDGISEAELEKTARGLLLDVQRIDRPSGLKSARLSKPRIGLYQPWTESIEEGWTELILENHEFDYSTLHNAEIKAGELDRRFDVLILPSQSPRSLLDGHAKGTMPPDYLGGIGTAGAANLKHFAEEGGTLVAMGAACDFAIEEYRLPVRNVLKSLKPEEFFASGLLVGAVFDPDNPVAFGMPEEAAAFFADSPTFEVLPSFGEGGIPAVAARYAEENLVLSGWMVGENYLRNKAAAVVVPFGKGKIILLGFNVQHRGQTKATFKLLFNSILSSVIKD